MNIIHKTATDYNTIAQYFSDTRQHPWTELLPLKEYVKDGMRVMDWGAGNGRLIRLLADKKIEYRGLDISAKLLAIARRSAKELNFGNAKFYCTLGRDKKFTAGYFDLIFAIASFHHLPDEKSRLKVLKKFFRELKSGGHLIMTNWNLDSDWAKSKKDYKKISEQDYLVPYKDPQQVVLTERYYHHFTTSEITELLEKVGFEVEKIGYVDGTWTDKKSGRNLLIIATK